MVEFIKFLQEHLGAIAALCGVFGIGLELAPVKLSPISFVLKKAGHVMNSELIKKVEKIEKEFDQIYYNLLICNRGSCPGFLMDIAGAVGFCGVIGHLGVDIRIRDIRFKCGINNGRLCCWHCRYPHRHRTQPLFWQWVYSSAADRDSLSAPHFEDTGRCWCT